MLARTAVALLAALAAANVYDVIMPHYTADPDLCDGSCRPWNHVSDDPKVQAAIDSYWKDGKPPAGIGNSCGMPANTAGMQRKGLDRIFPHYFQAKHVDSEVDPDDPDKKHKHHRKTCKGCEYVIDSYAGPWCVCDKPKSGVNATQFCRPSDTFPEQLNLQVASENIVVASFVTHDPKPPSSSQPPLAEIIKKSENKKSAPPKTVTGVTHFYNALTQSENMTYLLHFIKFDDLESNTLYEYRVKSGSPNSPFSDWHTFRSLSSRKSGLPTRIGIYGDMGHSHYNNMENLQTDCKSGKIEAIVHMGDHCYNMGDADDRRGDTYMNAFAPVLSSCPWIPIIGNHEHSDGDKFNRYLNMTYGETLGEDHSTSALGSLLTKGTLFGPGFHSEVPSNTSRYFSVSFGLVHLVGLDLNNLDKLQLAWLEEDLKSVDREATPWVIVSSHFPLHHSTTAHFFNASASYYVGDESESYAEDGHEFKPARCAEEYEGHNSQCELTVGEFYQQIFDGLEPLLAKYGVDIYDAGHNHDYNSNWPICYTQENGAKLCKKEDGSAQKDFHQPRGTVHITEGNGGVPGVVGDFTVNHNCSDSTAPWCRVYGTGGNYGRITAYNASTLVYEHVANNGGNVTDRFVIYQPKHGPFLDQEQAL